MQNLASTCRAEISQYAIQYVVTLTLGVAKGRKMGMFQKHLTQNPTGT
jgi:hypothetical protein